MLEIVNVSKKFNDKLAVDGISFSIKPGEILSLIGPNGSGKTTIIKMICGLLAPDSGRIVVGGHDTVREPEAAKGLTGYIPDEPAIWPYLSGEEFILMTGALYGLSADKRLAALPAFLDKFGLKGIEKDYFEDYSRGNKQKFSILAALSHEPKLLLIDEPIVGLDPRSALKAKEEFRLFARAGGAVLLVTHTLGVAEEISGRIGVLEQGKLLNLDTLAGLRRQAGLEESASLEEVYQGMVK